MKRRLSRPRSAGAHKCRARRRVVGVAPDDTEAAITELAALDIVGLRQRWQAWLGGSPPGIQSGRTLRMLLAWRLQERRFGGLSAAVHRRLRQLAKAESARRGGSKRLTYRPIRGMLLSREWKGAVHRVQVLDRGFAYRGTVYASLSRIARAITGTRWSGPRFFGLGRSCDNHGQGG